ncbi:MAG TPA: archease [Candidatus Polarisedimenticolaceae bacterium]|nr:archease [Candidatus Polarisedimenticolaceae bacterium]
MMYELFEHTADLGLRVRARDLAGLFRDAARGLFAMIVEPEPAGAPVGERSFALSAARYDHLLVDWLGELLCLFDSERLVAGDFRVELDGPKLTASAAIYDVAGGRFHVLREVKAITYHGLKVEPLDGGWLAELIVDI